MWHRTAAPPSFCPAVPSFLHPKRRVNTQTSHYILSIQKKDGTSVQGQRLNSALSTKDTQPLRRKRSLDSDTTHIYIVRYLLICRRKDHLLVKSHIAGPGLLCLACCPASVIRPQHYIQTVLLLSPPTSANPLYPTHIRIGANTAGPCMNCRLSLTTILLKDAHRRSCPCSRDFLDEHYLFYKLRDSILLSNTKCLALSSTVH